MTTRPHTPPVEASNEAEPDQLGVARGRRRRLSPRPVTSAAAAIHLRLPAASNDGLVVG